MADLKTEYENRVTDADPFPATASAAAQNLADAIENADGLKLSGQSFQVLFGTGVPGAGVGSNNDFFFRGDGTAGSCIYHKESGSWVAIA